MIFTLTSKGVTTATLCTWNARCPRRPQEGGRTCRFKTTGARLPRRRSNDTQERTGTHPRTTEADLREDRIRPHACTEPISDQLVSDQTSTNRSERGPSSTGHPEVEHQPDGFLQLLRDDDD